MKTLVFVIIEELVSTKFVLEHKENLNKEKLLRDLKKSFGCENIQITSTIKLKDDFNAAEKGLPLFQEISEE